jgi:hypothetical protein
VKTRPSFQKPIPAKEDSPHKTAAVQDYVSGTNGLLTLHYLPGYASEPNPDERVWSPCQA